MIRRKENLIGIRNMWTAFYRSKRMCFISPEHEFHTFFFSQHSEYTHLKNTKTSHTRDIKIRMKNSQRTKRWEQEILRSKTFFQAYENTYNVLDISYAFCHLVYLEKGTNGYCSAGENRHFACIITFHPHEAERHVLLFQFYTWNNWSL